MQWDLYKKALVYLLMCFDSSVCFQLFTVHFIITILKSYLYFTINLLYSLQCIIVIVKLPLDFRRGQWTPVKSSVRSQVTLACFVEKQWVMWVMTFGHLVILFLRNIWVWVSFFVLCSSLWSDWIMLKSLLFSDHHFPATLSWV